MFQSVDVKINQQDRALPKGVKHICRDGDIEFPVFFFVNFK